MLPPQGKLPTQWHTRCTAALTMAPVPQPPCSTNTEQWGSSESSPRSLKVQAACSTAAATLFSTTPMHQRVQLQWSAEKKGDKFHLLRRPLLLIFRSHLGEMDTLVQVDCREQGRL